MYMYMTCLDMKIGVLHCTWCLPQLEYEVYCTCKYGYSVCMCLNIYILSSLTLNPPIRLQNMWILIYRVATECGISLDNHRDIVITRVTRVSYRGRPWNPPPRKLIRSYIYIYTQNLKILMYNTVAVPQNFFFHHHQNILYETHGYTIHKTHEFIISFLLSCRENETTCQSDVSEIISLSLVTLS